MSDVLYNLWLRYLLLGTRFLSLGDINCLSKEIFSVVFLLGHSRLLMNNSYKLNMLDLFNSDMNSFRICLGSQTIFPSEDQFLLWFLGSSYLLSLSLLLFTRLLFVAYICCFGFSFFLISSGCFNFFSSIVLMSSCLNLSFLSMCTFLFFIFFKILLFL